MNYAISTDISFMIENMKKSEKCNWTILWRYHNITFRTDASTAETSIKCTYDFPFNRIISFILRKLILLDVSIFKRQSHRKMNILSVILYSVMLYSDVEYLVNKLKFPNSQRSWDMYGKLIPSVITFSSLNYIIRETINLRNYVGGNEHTWWINPMVSR